MYIRADWQSERALKARRFHVQLAFLIGGAIDATRKGKLCFEGEGGGEGSCFCSSTIEEPHLPGNRQIIRVKRWSFARDRAAIEFQWRTVLNGWLSDALDQRRYCDFDTRCCFCLIFERLREMTRPLSRQVFAYYLSAYSEKE